MSDKLVRFEVANHVAWVTLAREEVMNAVDAATERQLQAIWTEIERNTSVRAVVLTGSGERAFCAGADMKSPGGVSGLQYWATPRPGGFGGIALRDTLDVPVIARVNGIALGGGFEMVLGCDIVIASDRASFGLPEPRVGRLPLDGGMVLLQRQVSFRAAMGILLTGRRVGAQEALSLGIVNEVVAHADLDAAVERWLTQVLACAPLSLRAIKQSVRRTAHLGAAEAQAMRLPAVVSALESQDADEGVRAFRERRQPAWQGR